MMDSATIANMQLAHRTDSFAGTGCPQPGSPVVAKDMDSARIARKRYSLVPLSNGSRSTVGVIRH
jgi:hypothetical protein